MRKPVGNIRKSMSVYALIRTRYPARYSVFLKKIRLQFHFEVAPLVGSSPTYDHQTKRVNKPHKFK